MCYTTESGVWHRHRAWLNRNERRERRGEASAAKNLHLRSRHGTGGRSNADVVRLPYGGQGLGRGRSRLTGRACAKPEPRNAGGCESSGTGVVTQRACFARDCGENALSRPDLNPRCARVTLWRRVASGGMLRSAFARRDPAGASGRRGDAGPLRGVESVVRLHGGLSAECRTNPLQSDKGARNSPCGSDR